MSRISIPLSFVALLVAWPCVAQEVWRNLRRDEPQSAAPAHESLGAVTPTPEMWFYQQQWKRHDDTKMAVRRRAEQRAQDRHDRLASQRWYGIDNSRPTISCPYSGGYTAYMGSNTYEPERWRPMTAPVVVLRPSDVAR